MTPCTRSSPFLVVISCVAVLKILATAGLFLSSSSLNDMSNTQMLSEVTHLSDYTASFSSLLFDPKLFLNLTFFQSLQ